MKFKLQMKESIKKSVLIILFLLVNTLLTPVAFAHSMQSSNQVIPHSIKTTNITEPFTQGKGYQTGKFDLNAIQPTSNNWTRQTVLHWVKIL